MLRKHRYGDASHRRAPLPYSPASGRTPRTRLSALDPVPPGIVVQPLWLDYGPDVAALAWIGDEDGLANFLRILARGPRVALTVHFLPPLEGEALTNRKTIAAAARAAIVAAMEQGR